MLYALFNKEKVIGLFNNEKDCNLMADGLVKNNFVTPYNLKIQVFYENSITCVNLFDFNTNYESSSDEYEESSDYSSTEEYNSNEENVSENNEEQIKEKLDILNKLEELKEQKEKLLEKKNIFESDKKLYFVFKDEISKNEKFIIPDLFLTKFEIFKILEEQNKIDMDNFYNLYVKEDFHSKKYDNLFS